jgi:1-acyl-sn-glycerol-3-phosphate acyltransferase
MNSRINRPCYLAVRWILKILLRCIFKLQGFRISGREHLPGRRQGVILICNHAAFVDSIYLITAIKPGFVICGAKPKYFEKRIMRFLLYTANILKVESEGQFKKDCIDLLASKNTLLIYPEMGRNKEKMGPFKRWAAEVALEAAVDVIPCYLYGTTAGDTGAKQLFVGPSIVPEGNAMDLTRQFRESIEALRPNRDTL